jgi:hypothetical protein
MFLHKAWLAPTEINLLVFGLQKRRGLKGMESMDSDSE